MTILYFCRGLPFSDRVEYLLFRHVASIYGYRVVIVPYPENPDFLYPVINEYFRGKHTQNSIILGHSFGAPIALYLNSVYTGIVRVSW